MATRRRGQPQNQVVDPAVSRAKFERELAHFRSHADNYRRRGCLLVQAEFPIVELLIGAPRPQPSAVLFSVDVDFTNYDVDPPSVTFRQPWTRETLRASAGVWPLPVLDDPMKPRLLMQWWQPPNDAPFLCARGIREYHRNPGHSGDSWWLYRKRGEGTLASIAELLCSHGPDLIASYQIDVQIVQNGTQLQASARLSGFSVQQRKQ